MRSRLLVIVFLCMGLAQAAPLPQRLPAKPMPHDNDYVADRFYWRGNFGGPFRGAPDGEGKARLILETRFPCRQSIEENVAWSKEYRLWIVRHWQNDYKHGQYWSDLYSDAIDLARPWETLAEAWLEHDTCETPYWVINFMKRVEEMIGEDRFQRGDMPSVIPIFNP